MLLHTTPTKECDNCKAIFAKKVNCSQKEWEKRRACSVSCSRKLIGNSWLRQYDFKPGIQSGKPFKKGQTAGNKNIKWKGDAAGYVAKHIWVANHFGRPKECEHCGSIFKRMYHWANISGHYLRKRSDWMRLCVPCHKKYDLNNI